MMHEQFDNIMSQSPASSILESNVLCGDDGVLLIIEQHDVHPNRPIYQVSIASLLPHPGVCLSVCLSAAHLKG